MKKILCPTDFSACSMLGVEFAAHLAKKNGAEIHLLKILDVQSQFLELQTGTNSIPDGTLMMGLLRHTKNQMTKIKQLPYMKGVKIVDRIKTSVPVYQGINEYAETIEPDLIVMGTHGESGITERFIGSNSERVVRLANFPVLTIKKPLSSNDIKTVLFATDFSYEAYMVFPIVKQFAALFGSNIHIVKVNTINDFETTRHDRKLVENFKSKFGQDYCCSILNDVTKEAGIYSYGNSIKADMIALGTHGRTGLARFFTHSIAEEFISNCDLPVLTVNIERVYEHQKKQAEKREEEFIKQRSVS